MRYFKRRNRWLVGGFLCYVLVSLVFITVRGAITAAQVGPLAVFNETTYSSPIAISADNKLVWSVNPANDSVSVIRTDTNQVIKTIPVGNEPQSVALDPNNQFAFVANAASNSVTAIKIINPNPASFNAAVNITWKTGAEPFNIVSSPDGKRIFVANSGQDTITVINAINRTIIGNVNLRNSLCNVGGSDRHFQPRGLAVPRGNDRLYVTRFLSFTKSGGVQGNDNGEEGVVCRLNINTNSTNIASYVPTRVIRLAARNSGFLDANGSQTSAYPNQLQSIVIRDGHAYLPNIAASPSRPLKFDVDTQAFVNRIDNLAPNVNETDGGAFNLHLGARDPEPGKKKLFFANPWAIAFTTQDGPSKAYAVSAGSDLLVKLNVAANGALNFTTDGDTTRYIDLNDPANPATSGANAGKNPQGIVINDAGTTAYVINLISRNVSVINLNTDKVVKVIKTANLPSPGSLEETVQVGAEMFFSSRGNFVRPAGTTVSTQERLSQAGWQNCASCHFAGLTDGVIWQFNTGPRKSIPLDASFNPKNPLEQRILNYSAVMADVQDFENNIRNVSGPGPLATPQTCSAPPPDTSANDPNHGLLFGDNGNINLAPCNTVPLVVDNANRQQFKVQLPGSNVRVPALDALNEWVRLAVRTPNGPLTTAELTSGGGNPTGGVNPADISAGRGLFLEAKCQTCHVGGKWTKSTKDFNSPPAAAQVFTEAGAANVNLTRYLNRFLRDIKSFNLNVPGSGNAIPGQPKIGAVEVDTAGLAALGKDHNGDGKGNGFNIPSLLGIHAVPPYYHNGACETLACVVADVNHRRAGLQPGDPDPLNLAANRTKLVRFLESIDEDTAPVR